MRSWNHIIGPRTECRINLITLFFSFAMVPKYIYLEKARHKHLLNTVSLALCLATGSDRIIAKQGNNLIIELVCYDTKNLCLPFSPVSQLTLFKFYWKLDYDYNLTTLFQLSPYLKASEYLPKPKILKTIFCWIMI